MPKHELPIVSLFSGALGLDLGPVGETGSGEAAPGLGDEGEMGRGGACDVKRIADGVGQRAAVGLELGHISDTGIARAISLLRMACRETRTHDR